MDFYYNQNGLSYHPNDRTYNERNIGYGLSARLNPKDRIVHELALGKYKNSINKNSNYLDYSIHKKIADGLMLGAGMGAVTGYGDATPYILPSLKYELDDYNVNLRYAPKTSVNPEVWMMNFGYRLK